MCEPSKSRPLEPGVSDPAQGLATYVLGYLCLWMGSGWQCGCRDAAWTQRYWQIQQFKR
jgi:hypothetical protein